MGHLYMLGVMSRSVRIVLVVVHAHARGLRRAWPHLVAPSSPLLLFLRRNLLFVHLIYPLKLVWNDGGYAARIVVIAVVATVLVKVWFHPAEMRRALRTHMHVVHLTLPLFHHVPHGRDFAFHSFVLREHALQRADFFDIGRQRTLRFLQLRLELAESGGRILSPRRRC